MTAALGRVLISELDSLAQAELFAAGSVSDAVEVTTARLRVGALVADRVVITDAMLLDGAYFLSLGPAGVAAALGRGHGPLPVVVTTQHASLAAALKARTSQRHFRWSSTSTLIGSRSRPWRSWSPAMEHAWSEWLAAADRGLLTVERQVVTTRRLDLGEAPAASAAGRALARALAAEARRSVALRLWEVADVDEAERDALRAWWMGGYFRLLALNAGADWISFDAALRESTPDAASIRIPLPATLVDWARSASTATFSLAWDASVRQRARLRERPTWSRMRDLAYAATAVSQMPTRRRVIIGAATSTAVAVAAIALAVPAWTDTPASESVTWMAFAVLFVTTFPLAAVRLLVRLLARDRRAVLTVLPKDAHA
ncbi:hypothetical protein [Microbacterium thalli]|uniref:Uncharacterized protein n=1 Tax=Microbacterium thalli TaxID=3027921 RepID=A0ABT5SJ10_9MICO|nr:hypothetical protein [Microbacterium thalli]MDD7962161.1 hypothetical protein [Microbacterium thalli]